ncbi:GDSL-type esterase/lipase family protein [Polaribacter ponticola]|uniref:GDSL-type esterase/lipase family protein n=1 Tax=Polaribacter ponticola TaxID=2978475 RepID=A0ABT5SB83_9FLAO|nr:GDSL-type esterase/lipase family protein [Polaribacter sp. MSW5]MDD7915335.1 GDSL-type esterase/lipase family protein [Polaribacter sp. MSW5]
MKKLLIILILTFVNIGFAQQYSDHYYKRKTLFESEKDTKNEIIFLGNSITEGGKWKKLFPNKNVINRGISGDVTDGILNRLLEITASKPKKIFLLIGTNDIARGKSIDYVLENTEKIILQIKSQSPKTIIYLQSILPINPNIGKKFSGHKKNNQKIIDANKRLKELAKKLNVKFINLNKKMRNGKKHIKAKYTYDGLHLSKKGYQKWKRIVRKYVE